MEWFLKVVRDNYANFTGRARRKEFWMFYLINWLIILALALVVGAAASLENETLTMALVGLVGLVMLALVVPTFAVIVRRLHDTGRSGWWFLLSLIPLGGIVLLVFYVTEGDPGPNEYGEDPKANERFY